MHSERSPSLLETRKIFLRSLHCVICGEHFYNDAPFFAFIPNWHERDIHTFKNARVRSVYQLNDTTDQDCEFHDEGNYPVAPSLHSICWRALERRANANSLSNLAYALLPSLNTKTTGNVHALSNKFLLSEAVRQLCEASHDDLRQAPKLFNTLDRLRKLPEEIILLILESLPLTIVKCLISLQATVKLIGEASVSGHWTGVLLLHGQLNIFFRPLFGENYVCGLHNTYQQFGRRSEDNQQVQIESPVVAISSIIGLYGVMGIEYLMKNGKRGYIGYPISNFDQTRRIHITSQNTANPFFLKVEGDGLKIRTIQRHPSETPEFADFFTWDTHFSLIFSSDRDPRAFFLHPRQKDYTPDTAKLCMRCVPFKERGATMYGLTVACSAAGGIVGIGTHFCYYSTAGKQSKYSIWKGQSAGCYLHIRLKPKDRVTAVWIIFCQGGFFDYPYLGISSSEGHSYALAPQIPKTQTSIQLLADESRGELLGIYFDDSPGTPHRINSFGVFSSASLAQTYSGKAVKPDFSCCRPETSRLNASVWEQFSSYAIFDNVTCVDTCSMGVRCTGMILTYLDGNQKVLGQWLEDDLSKSVTFHQLEPAPRQGLRFFLANTQGNPYLERVELRSRECRRLPAHTPGQIIVDADNADTIIWLFSYSSDAIHCERY